MAILRFLGTTDIDFISRLRSESSLIFSSSLLILMCEGDTFLTILSACLTVLMLLLGIFPSIFL